MDTKKIKLPLFEITDLKPSSIAMSNVFTLLSIAHPWFKEAISWNPYKKNQNGNFNGFYSELGISAQIAFNQITDFPNYYIVNKDKKIALSLDDCIEVVGMGFKISPLPVLVGEKGASKQLETKFPNIYGSWRNNSIFVCKELPNYCEHVSLAGLEETCEPPVDLGSCDMILNQDSSIDIRSPLNDKEEVPESSLVCQMSESLNPTTNDFDHNSCSDDTLDASSDDRNPSAFEEVKDEILRDPPVRNLLKDTDKPDKNPREEVKEGKKEKDKDSTGELEYKTNPLPYPPKVIHDWEKYTESKSKATDRNLGIYKINDFLEDLKSIYADKDLRKRVQFKDMKFIQVRKPFSFPQEFWRRLILNTPSGLKPCMYMYKRGYSNIRFCKISYEESDPTNSDDKKKGVWKITSFQKASGFVQGLEFSEIYEYWSKNTNMKTFLPIIGAKPAFSIKHYAEIYKGQEMERKYDYEILKVLLEDVITDAKNCYSVQKKPVKKDNSQVYFAKRKKKMDNKPSKKERREYTAEEIRFFKEF
jgi:hypothetical protein